MKHGCWPLRVARFFDDNSWIAESMRRIEFGISTSRSQRIEPTHQLQPSHLRSKADTQWERIVGQSMSAPPSHRSPFSITLDGYLTYNTTRIEITAAKLEVNNNSYTRLTHLTSTVMHESNTINMIDRSTSWTYTIQTGYRSRHLMPSNDQYSYCMRICVRHEHPNPSSLEQKCRTPYGF